MKTCPATFLVGCEIIYEKAAHSSNIFTLVLLNFLNRFIRQPATQDGERCCEEIPWCLHAFPFLLKCGIPNRSLLRLLLLREGESSPLFVEGAVIP